MFYVYISLCVQSDWSDVAVWSKECGSVHLHGASLGQRPLSNREISRELIESRVKLQRSVFLLLCRLHKTALASLREQQGLVVSDCVVSHSGGCLETHGWVQLPAITERVCVCACVCGLPWKALRDGAPASRFLPSPRWPAYGVGGAPPFPPLAWQRWSTSVNDFKPVSYRRLKVMCSFLVEARGF